MPTFNYTGNLQKWTVPETGRYRITAAGASGGDGTFNQAGQQGKGGKGSTVTGDIYLQAGQQLQIVVGGQGHTTNNTVFEWAPKISNGSSSGVDKTGGSSGGIAGLFDEQGYPLFIASGGEGGRDSCFKTDRNADGNIAQGSTGANSGSTESVLDSRSTGIDDLTTIHVDYFNRTILPYRRESYSVAYPYGTGMNDADDNPNVTGIGKKAFTTNPQGFTNVAAGNHVGNAYLTIELAGKEIKQKNAPIQVQDIPLSISTSYHNVTCDFGEVMLSRNLASDEKAFIQVEIGYSVNNQEHIIKKTELKEIFTFSMELFSNSIGNSIQENFNPTADNITIHYDLWVFHPTGPLRIKKSCKPKDIKVNSIDTKTTYVEDVKNTLANMTYNVANIAYGGDDSHSLAYDGKWVYWSNDTDHKLKLYQVSSSSITHEGDIILSGFSDGGKNTSRVYVRHNHVICFFDRLNTGSSKYGYMTGGQNFTANQTVTVSKSIDNYLSILGDSMIRSGNSVPSPWVAAGYRDGFWIAKVQKLDRDCSETIDGYKLYAANLNYAGATIRFEKRRYTDLSLLKHVDVILPTAGYRSVASLGGEGISGGFELSNGLLVIWIGDTAVGIDIDEGKVLFQQGCNFIGDNCADVVWAFDKNVMIQDGGDNSNETLYVHTLPNKLERYSLPSISPKKSNFLQISHPDKGNRVGVRPGFQFKINEIKGEEPYGFVLQLATDLNFTQGLQEFDSTVMPKGWEYGSGENMSALPSNGLLSAEKLKNKMILYHTQADLVLGQTYFLRIKPSSLVGESYFQCITYFRVGKTLAIQGKKPIKTNVPAERISTTLLTKWKNPLGNLYVCNNALDSNPTWEDATDAHKKNQPYLFTNKTKTAKEWAINYKIISAEISDGDTAIEAIGFSYD